MTPPEAGPAATEFTALAVRLDVRLENLHDDVREIKSQVKQTNGRVTQLELWQATIHGIQISTRWMPPVMSALMAAAATKLFA